ncbi:MAG: hypothetical protein H0X03_05940 [Nitrosopumilus sp.]|nr:hypothetical protein [Nitrosopumilus sp.]
MVIEISPTDINGNIDIEDTNIIIKNVTNKIKRWSWACRILNSFDSFELDTSSVSVPTVGDIAIFKVSRIGLHKHIVTSSNKRLRIYLGDLIVGVFGNRYATDALEGEVEGLSDLSLLTAGGMVGTVKSRHHSVSRPTQLSFVSFLNDASGQKINLKQIKFKKIQPSNHLKNIIVVVGSGMSSGKTTTCRKIIKSLSEMGLKVAACKLTGSISNRDQDEMISASAGYTIDFSDYGFPSTYKCDQDELLDLFNTMVSDIQKVNPDVTIMEIADGVLQRETQMLLSNPKIQESVKGVVITADNAPSALYTVAYLKNKGYNVIAVSGTMTSSPLYVREFEQNSDIQVISSAQNRKKMSSTLSKFIVI